MTKISESEARAVFWNISLLRKLYSNNIPKNLTIKDVRTKLQTTKGAIQDYD